MKPTTVLAFLFATVLALPGQAQEKGSRMYKCIDSAGKAYYSDKIGPECGQASELNRQGVVMPKKKPAASPVQPKVDPAAATPKAAKEQERRDQALIATYTSEEEIDAARDRSLAIPAQGTKSVEAKLEAANDRLAALKKQADTLAAQQKPLPAHLIEEVSTSQKQVARLEADVSQRKAQSDAIRAKYEADKKRFRELKGADGAGK